MGRNNDVLDHFLWKYNCEGKQWEKYGGNIMYVYGLDHVELGEHFLVSTVWANNGDHYFLRKEVWSIQQLALFSSSSYAYASDVIICLVIN